MVALAGAGLAVCVVSLIFDSRAPVRAQTPDLAQGKYIVERAGMCIDCHGATLMGGPNPPGPPGVPWAKAVPAIRGLPMFESDAAAVKFLETAVKPDGTPALGPMPHYRFKPSDATALVAYLRSLK